MINRQVRLIAKGVGIPQAEQFAIVQAEVSSPEDGQILVRNRFLSVDPAMKGWVSDRVNNMSEMHVGETMRAHAVADVVESRHPDFRVGDMVVGWFGWQDYACVGAEAVWRKVVERDLPASLALGVLGLTGLTAHRALLLLGAPQDGETVLVSTAAGACGSTVGQIAKIKGCRAIGITGGPQKVKACIEEFGYDDAVDYKRADFAEELQRACGKTINVYFDNTAGPVSDAVRPHLALRARVIVCGTASVSSWDPPPSGPRWERLIMTHRLRVEGFVIFDHMHDAEGPIAELAEWVRQGKLRYREDTLDGLEACPGAIAGLYRGENLGKRIIRL